MIVSDKKELEEFIRLIAREEIAKAELAHLEQEKTNLIFATAENEIINAQKEISFHAMRGV